VNHFLVILLQFIFTSFFLISLFAFCADLLLLIRPFTFVIDSILLKFISLFHSEFNQFLKNFAVFEALDKIYRSLT